jgi:hypothetical protein
MRRNYHWKGLGEIIPGNYEEKLSQEIMRRTHHRKLSASIYHQAKNVGIIGILTYPKIRLKRNRENRHVPLPFRGKRAENCSHTVGESLGEGLAYNFSYRRKDIGWIRRLCRGVVNGREGGGGSQWEGRGWGSQWEGRGG